MSPGPSRAGRPAVSAPRPKHSTGLPVFDAISGGGLPVGRASLLLGSAGSGKTIFAMQTLAHAAARGEPGLFVAFEERPEDLRQNMAGFAWDLESHVAAGRITLLDARMSIEAQLSGDSEISGLLALVAELAGRGGARWVVFDSLDAVLAMTPDERTRQRELLRLHRWAEESGLTCLITCKRGAAWNTQIAVESDIGYLVDCVVELESRIGADTFLRALRILKYRGSAHETEALPFVIGEAGIELVPVIADQGNWPVSHERLSTGVPALDEMLGGGLLRGANVLLSGAPGTAKSSISGRFVETQCERGERALVVCFDEAPLEAVRNLTSIGIHFEPHLQSGLLRIVGLGGRARNPDLAFARMHDLLAEHRPSVVVVDPISGLTKGGGESLAYRALLRLVQVCKLSGTTLVMPCLTARNALAEAEESQIHASTLADVWIHLSYLVRSGERNRLLTIVKARGTTHSNQVRELLLGDDGITLAEPYIEEGEVLVGTMRWQRERRNEQLAREREAEAEAARLAMADKRSDLLGRIDALQRELQRLEASGARQDRRDEAALADREAQRVGTLARRSSAKRAKRRRRGRR